MEKWKISVAILAGLLLISTVFAGKPAEVMDWSNGFPSGEHYNLNIHGKRADFVCDQAVGGSSLFVPEYGQSSIQIVQNKKSTLDGMYVHDACSFGTEDPAVVQLPSGEYQVYARILGKPSKPGDERSVVFYPKLVDACNDNVTPIDGFGDYIDCSHESLVGLGIVTANGAWDKESQSLERIAPAKGSNKAVDISQMFSWSGYACSEAYDIDGDGEITVGDVQVDLNGDGVIDGLDLALYLENNCQYFDHEWIFNIADLVVYGWDYNNAGSKLVQVRFYPVQ